MTEQNAKLSFPQSRLVSKSRQSIHKRGLPVNRNFIGSIISLIVSPIGGRLSTANEIAGPGIFYIVRTGAPIVWIHRWLKTESGDIRATVIIPAEKMANGIQNCV